MKTNIKLAAVLGLMLGITACKKDFLDLQPLDTLSSTNSLASTNELRMYMNQFYQDSIPGHPLVVGGEGIAFDDAGTDNMIFSAVNTRTSGLLALSNARAINEYKSIRNLNYFLENYKNAKGDGNLINHYLGEAKFFRAQYYFNMVRKYGDVTWINRVLPADQQLMEVPRDPRTLVIDSVLADLDQAITLLPVQASSASMRIHKDVALALKSRVALYEGSWQKYHKAKADVFYTKTVTDDKIRNYFEQSRDAASTIMSSGRWAISNTGKALEDYANLFVTYDLSTNKEVMFWKRYNTGENIAHSLSKYTSTAGADLGLTLSLVDDYLSRDGQPFTGAARDAAQAVYGKELDPTIRDPRLSQTVAVPGKPLKPGVTVPEYPPINQTGFNRSATGYPLYKYLEFNSATAVADDFKSMAPAIRFRYAEVLLNYAEAVAELGGSESLIAEALLPIRLRAGMPAVNFDREYNNSADYPFRSLSKVLQAVRRERRIEMACEGTRLDDIMRWAAADILLVNKRQAGARFVGSDMAQQNVAGGFYGSSMLYFDSAPAGRTINLFLTGNPGDSKRYIDPYKNVLPAGSGFNLNRDYLLPIQQRMLQLTGGQWAQNPGW